jgi:hypothetical protein
MWQNKNIAASGSAVSLISNPFLFGGSRLSPFLFRFFGNTLGFHA